MSPFGPWPGKAAAAPPPTPDRVWLKHSGLVQSNPVAGITLALADAAGAGTSSGARDLESYPIPEAITLDRMRVFLPFEWAGDADLTVTVRKNDVDTALTVTFPTPTAGGTQKVVSASVAFAAGDLYSVVVATLTDTGGPSDIGITALVTGAL